MIFTTEDTEILILITFHLFFSLVYSVLSVVKQICVYLRNLRIKLLIEINDDPVGYGVRLAGEYITRRQFVRFQGVVDIHIHFSFQQFCLAGCTDAAFTGKWQVNVVIQGAVEDVFVRLRSVQTGSAGHRH